MVGYAEDFFLVRFCLPLCRQRARPPLAGPAHPRQQSSRPQVPSPSASEGTGALRAMSEPPLFDAFEAAALLPDEVPGHLESIAVRGEQLVVGTSDGQLLLYQISPAHVSPSGTAEPPTCVMSARRSLGCGRNAVSRIELCSATGTGFALCDATVSLFELHDGIQMSGALPASKGTTALCFDAACQHVVPSW